MKKFSASSSALGYLYQAIQGLSLLLDAEANTKMYLERYDDVEFEKVGNNRELIQLKHKIKSSNTISDTSPDLWKTLRIWIESFQNGDFDIDNTIFTIMTTNEVPKNSVASMLGQEDTERNTKTALQTLQTIAEKGINKENKKAYEIFLNFDFANKYKLLDNIRILTSTPDIVNTENKIVKQLKLSARKEHLQLLYENLQGWWFKVVIEHLSGDSKEPIYYDELEAKIQDLRDQYHSLDLPIDYKNLLPTEKEETSAKQHLFVKQLNLIMLTEPRIKKAITDYFKAYSQRSKWIREKLIFLKELEGYESTLIDEWERYFHKTKEKLYDSTGERELRTAGKEVFDWMDTQANFCIRKYCTEPYVMRGSYHMLADKLHVGWHPNFVERLEKLLVNKSKAGYGTYKKAAN